MHKKSLWTLLLALSLFTLVILPAFAGGSQSKSPAQESTEEQEVKACNVCAGKGWITAGSMFMSPMPTQPTFTFRERWRRGYPEGWDVEDNAHELKECNKFQTCRDARCEYMKQKESKWDEARAMRPSCTREQAEDAMRKRIRDEDLERARRERERAINNQKTNTYRGPDQYTELRHTYCTSSACAVGFPINCPKCHPERF